MSKLDAALDLATRRFLIFPIVPNGKKPAFKGDWREHATCDPAKVRELWQGKNYNIGIWAKDMLILDFDTKGGRPGKADLAALIDKGLDVGALVETPTGGFHAYLRMPAGVTVANAVGTTNLGKGVDIRGDSGYVVGPGSVIEERPYKWVNTPDSTGEVELAPQWLIDSCKPPREKETLDTSSIELDTDTATKRATAYLIDTAPCAVEGEGGNQATYQIAARVKDFGISEALCLDLLLDHWNPEKAIPPWPPDELERIVGNAYRYGTAAIGKFDASLEFEPYDGPISTPKTSPASAAKRPGAGRLTVWSFGEAVAKAADPAPQYLVKDILDRETLSMVYGQSNAGKSFVVLELCRCVAMGAPFAGRKTKPGAVLYIGLEGQRRLANRFLALCREKTGGQLPPLYMATGRVNLFANDDSVREIVEHAKEIAEGEFPLALIVIDTLARAAAGARENEASDMNVVLDRARQIIAATGAHVCLIHHPGKDESKGARGSYVMTADVDTLIRVKADQKSKKSGKIIFDKQRDGEKIEDVIYRLCKVKIGCDEELNDITSCIVNFGPVRETVADQLTETLQKALQAFDDAAAAAPEGVVRTEAWLAAAANRANDEKDDPPTKKSIENSQRRLVEIGAIVKVGRGKYQRAPADTLKAA